MTDLILQTDPLEFQNSRQSTKIIFLQQELQQAQEYARDLEQIVKINKEALRIATQPSKPIVGKSKSPAVNESTSTFDTNTSSRDEVKRLQSLVEKLTEENSKFLEIVDKAKKERNTAQSKALISEQICEEAQRHESETVHELEEKITDLRKLLQDKEYAIQELEKLKPIPEQEGVVIKYREVLNPTEQNMRFHNEIDSLNGMLAKVSKELNKVQLEKQEFQHLNYSLTTELAKVKATFSSPLTHQKNFGRLNSGSEIPPGFQGAYFQPPIEFLDENSPLPSPLPSHGGEAFNQQASKAPVPKLDLSKAKQIQEQYAKKITQPQQQNYNQTYTVPAMDKVKQLEEELELTRKRFSHEMINNRLLGEELARMKKQLIQVISTNDILIKSNKRYEEKWQKIFYTLEFYKDFYHKYIDLITRGPGGHMKSASMSTSTPKFDSVPKFNGKFFTNLDSDPEKMIKDLRRNNEDHGKHVNVSILEANEEESEHEPGSTNEDGKLNNVIEFNKEQSKIYLLNLAKDLYVNSNLQKSNIAKRMLQNLKIGTNGAVPKPIFKLKRSLSNPLEYVSERKQLIIEPKGGNANKLKKLRHEEEELDGHEEEFENNDGEGTPASSGNVLNIDPNSVKLPKHKFDMHDEMISFTVDPDDFNKNRMVEASFISNTDILENLRNN